MNIGRSKKNNFVRVFGKFVGEIYGDKNSKVEWREVNFPILVKLRGKVRQSINIPWK